MAYLALVLKDAASRWTNAVVAAISALFALSTLISQPAGMSAGVNFVAIVGILVALLIISHAWKGPRGAEVTPVTPSRQSREAARR
jgi:protein-S-isoprenylcysteine O-methyltransferase Ste14